MSLECDGEARAGCRVVASFFHNEMKLADEQRMLSIYALRQATALATSVCVLRIYRMSRSWKAPGSSL